VPEGKDLRDSKQGGTEKEVSVKKGSLESLIELSARAAREMVRQKKVLVVTHIDADGMAAGGLASRVLETLGIEHEVIFFKQLDQGAIEKIREKDVFTWFTDLGTGSFHLLRGIDGVVTDHHTPQPEPRADVVERDKRDVKDAADGGILSYNEFSFPHHINPHLVGIDGTREISGAGVTFALALAVDRSFSSLAHLAIVGALGDMQDMETGKLVGVNREILSVGTQAGVLAVDEDVRFFGRETRPLHKFLVYGIDRTVEGLKTEEDAINLLVDLDIKLRRDTGEWRTWYDLSPGEKKRVAEKVFSLMRDSGIDPSIYMGEVYVLPVEEPGSGLHDAKEYATLLNSCGRYGRGDLGIRIARGERGEVLDEARNLRRGHRKNLVESMAVVEEIGISETPGLYWFHAGGMVRDTVLGTVAGMVYKKRLRRDKPIMAFAESDNGTVKVSIRATQEMVDRGLDLSEVMKQASKKVGGEGGGHKIAAGATIPSGKEMEFLDIVEKEMERQMGKEV